jgi:hypothetical protein
VDDGLSRRLDEMRRSRIQALGNAVVPINAAMIGRAIISLES